MRTKETIAFKIDYSLMSEVEINKGLICEGDILYYVDSANCQRWEVIELFDGGFAAKDDYEEKDFFFSELQKGWEISERTKEKHIQYDRFQYKSIN